MKTLIAWDKKAFALFLSDKTQVIVKQNILVDCSWESWYQVIHSSSLYPGYFSFMM